MLKYGPPRGELKWIGKAIESFRWIREGLNLEDAAADVPFDLLENKGGFNNPFHAPARGWADPLLTDMFDAGLGDDVYLRHKGGESTC
ncbi:MAG: hypothetical protein VST72_06710 [Nitrospirota bacterium]|nr:hypothetical protein [Nitrospirota bacterium]